MQTTGSLLPLLRQRRSIRKFQPRQVETEKLEQLLEALLRSPSSRGKNPWEFVVVRQPKLLQKLALAKQHGSAFLAGAPLAIVIAADPQISDVWVEDASIAATLLQLSAVSLGLGSCWAQLRLRAHDEQSSAESYVKRLLGLPESFGVVCIIGVGYPDEEKAGHGEASLQRDKLHMEGYRC